MPDEMLHQFTEDFYTLSNSSLPIHLTIADPAYGGIVDQPWDKLTEQEALDNYIRLMQRLEVLSVEGASAYVFGGIGKPGNRVFLKAIPIIEETTRWQMSTLITWAKKRAYGIQWGYLFCREEIAFFVLGDRKKPRTFHVPLLDVKRGYEGYEQNVLVGYFDGCYHTREYGLHKDTPCSCMSSRSQTSSKGLVYQLLRQATVAFRSGVSQTTPPGLVRKEPMPSYFLQADMGKEESCTKGTRGSSSKRQKTRDSVYLDSSRLKGGLDRSVSGVWDSNCCQRQEEEQLCWVCTWEHLRHVMEGQPSEAKRFDRGVGNPSCLSENPTIKDVAIMEKSVLYPAKSEYKRRTNVWSDVTEILRGKIHQCQKPDRLYEVMVEASSNPGENVLDPFAGSGTLGRVGHDRNRYLVDLNLT
jgi:hypothetical protein